MVVLKNFTGQWRLFLVLEMVGLSVTLAVFSVKVTGNDMAVGGDGFASQCDLLRESGDCGIYSWWFVLHTLPVSFTLVALLLSSAISNPDSFLLVRVFRPLSRGSCSWLSLLLLALLGVDVYDHLDTPAWWPRPRLYLGIVALAYMAFFRRGQLRQAYVDGTGTEKLSEPDRRRRRQLFRSGTGVVLLGTVLEIVPVCLSAKDGYAFHAGPYEPVRVVLGLLDIVVWLVLYTWLIGGMGLPAPADPRSTGVNAPNGSLVDSARSMLLGWGIHTGVSEIRVLLFSGILWPLIEKFPNTMAWPVVYLLDNMVWLTWVLATGTWLRTENGIGNVAYWNAVILLSNQVVFAVWAWVSAFIDGTVT